MRHAWIIPVLLTIACGADASVADAPAVADATAPPDATTASANSFDPGAIQPGDILLGLTVVSKDVQRVTEDSVWVGDVLFEGDLVLQGVYQLHFDWPQVAVPCFHVNDPGSAARIPRFAPDSWTSPGIKTWFCFSNPEVALEMLGAPEQPREAVIAVDRYQVWRQVTDVWDEAGLAELLDLGATSHRTLRDP